MTAEIERAIRERLVYDPETGIIRWKVATSNRVKVGDEAGSMSSDGYRSVQICGRAIRSHRIAWFLMHGVWPADQIDHRNGVKTDNRIENLRDVSGSENMRNQRCHRAGRLPYTRKHRNRWKSHFWENGKYIYLGYYATEQDAHQAAVAYLQGSMAVSLVG